VFYHCYVGYFFPSVPLIRKFFASGYTGVTLFFALSGFILAYNYPVVKNRRDFWISRFARIYPAYLVSILLGLMLVLHGQHLISMAHLSACFLATLLLVQSWWPAWANVFNTVAWTLSIEAFFYLVFPWAIPLCRRATRRHIALFLAVYLAWVILPLVLPHLGVPSSLALSIATWTEGPIPFFRLGTFIIGMLAGVRFLRNPTAPTWLLPASLLLSFLILIWNPAITALPLKTFLISCTYTCMLFALATANIPTFGNRWLLLGGEISYSIYLLQNFVFHVTNILGLRLHTDISISAQNLAVVPLLILLAFCNFHWVEIPARRLLRGLLLKRPAHS
jgi:peptidoglycan/LPS O-acetylase OafA/YrhL